MIKRYGKSVLCFLLERQVKRLRRRNDFKIVAVGGSVGKTSSKLAIAKTLSASRKVIYQEGNYNDRLTVPLVLFGQDQPGIFNIFAWLKLLQANRKKIKNYAYDVAVLEIGTDAPGQMRKFAYLQPDVYVLTAIADEHMEYFKSLEAVAKEELSPTSFSKQLLINVDDVPAEYLPKIEFQGYGIKNGDYKVIERQPRALKGQLLKIGLPNKELMADVLVLGGQGAKLVVAAVAVADMLGIGTDDIGKGLRRLTPVAGRMQILQGQKGATIIDDTYNASPISP